MRFSPSVKRVSLLLSLVFCASLALAMPAILFNFTGIGRDTANALTFPPGSNIAIGPNHVVQVVNGAFAVFDKKGQTLAAPAPTKSLWAGFASGGCASNAESESFVRYDQVADRWVIVRGEDTLGTNVLSGPFWVCVAVSKTADPTGAYYPYAFQSSEFFSSLTLAVWSDAYYISMNLYNSTSTNGIVTTVFDRSQVCALDRASMLSGLPATQQCVNTGPSYFGVLPSDLDGRIAPPSGSPNYILSLGAQDGALAFWKFHVDWTTPTNTTLNGPTNLPTDAYTLPCADAGGACVPQKGTTTQLDTVSYALMPRLAYRNFGDHESLVVNHTITAGNTVGLRWYELRSLSGAPIIFQQGTYAPADSNFRWLGSTAMDASGNMALGFSISSSTLNPSIAWTGRLANDPPGVMAQGETDIFSGAVSQSQPPWGPYSSMNIDPSDDCTFWYSNEYIVAATPTSLGPNWRTQIAAFKFPSCVSSAANQSFSLTASPQSQTVTAQQTATYTIAGSQLPGPVDLSVIGLPPGAIAAFSPNPTTGISTLTVTTSANTPPGTSLLTVSGSANGSVVTTTATLVVRLNDFSISIIPSSSVVQGGASTSVQVVTALSSGAAQSIQLTASGLPTGITANFNPSAVSSGQFSTLTLTADTTVAFNSSAVVTVTGTAAEATHNATLSLETLQAGSAVVGATGPQGPQGLPGPAGATGAAGPIGPAGPQGAPGGPGAVGPIGPAGPAGATGTAGPVGSMGPQGAPGAPGAIGPAGPAGPQGAVGSGGPQGPQGMVGPVGLPGMIGPMGPQGIQGLQGTAGTPGPTGSQVWASYAPLFIAPYNVATLTPDNNIEVTRVQAQLGIAPIKCGTNPVLTITDGTKTHTLPIAAATNDSGAITLDFVAGAHIVLSLTAASHCEVWPAAANVVVQYKVK